MTERQPFSDRKGLHAISDPGEAENKEWWECAVSLCDRLEADA